MLKLPLVHNLLHLLRDLTLVPLVLKSLRQDRQKILDFPSLMELSRRLRTHPRLLLYPQEARCHIPRRYIES
jgi:hypothetical protein